MLTIQKCMSIESHKDNVTVVTITTPDGQVFTAQSTSPGIARDMAWAQVMEATIPAPTEPIVIEEDQPQDG
jgi:hypothetical protein